MKTYACADETLVSAAATVAKTPSFTYPPSTEIPLVHVGRSDVPPAYTIRGAWLKGNGTDEA